MQDGLPFCLWGCKNEMRKVFAVARFSEVVGNLVARWHCALPMRALPNNDSILIRCMTMKDLRAKVLVG